MAVSSGVSKAQRGKSYNGSSMRKMQASMEALATQVESLVRAKGSTLADSTAKSRTASSGTVFEPKHMLSRDIDTAARYKAAGYMNLSSTVDSFDVTGENAHSHDALDIYAQQIIFLLQSNVGFTFSHLAKHQKMLMYRYFYRTNPIVGRVLDLHTDLPLSKLDFQPPANQPEIVKDFVVAFYTRVFKKINVNEFLREIVLHYWIYGEGYGCIDDYFAKHDIELQDLSKLDARMYQKSEAETKILEEVEAKYADNPSGVNVVARLEYLQRKFKNFFCVEYTGPDRIFVIPFYQISEYYENRDIRYEAIKYAISPELASVLESGDIKKFEDLKEIGYSEGFISLLGNADNVSSSMSEVSGVYFGSSVLLDNDRLSGFPYIFSFKRPDSHSVLARVASSCLEYDASKRATKAKLDMFGRVGRIVTAEGIADDQLEELRNEVFAMMEDPTQAIVTNYQLNWQEVNTFVKDELNALEDKAASLKDEIALGLGMPESLISGESQYTGDTIKVEMLNTQYGNFKDTIQMVFEEYLLKPIAQRKGLVSLDDWGHPVLVYPKLVFTKMPIRDSTVFDVLMNLYLKGSLPVKVLYELLNIDSSDTERAIKKDLFTVNDPNMNAMVQAVQSAVAQAVAENTNVLDTVIVNLGLAKVEKPQPSEDDDSGGGYGG